MKGSEQSKDYAKITPQKTFQTAGFFCILKHGKISKVVCIKENIMKKFSIILAAFVLLLVGCSALPFSLNESKIKSITIGDSTSLNSKEIEEFAELFNLSKRYRDDVGTTHPIFTTITMDDDSVVRVWSGTQGFLTTANEDEQYNITNEKLEEFIESFVSD